MEKAKKKKVDTSITDKQTIYINGLRRSSNIFIIGDLLIDHTAFVQGKSVYPLPVTGEMAYQVRRRIDTAGGAATTARTINNLSEGSTFLWGLIGASPWGTFRNILENSQALDGSKNRIEFRGVQDETDGSMTTISRLVEVSESEGHYCYIRKARFADSGQTHIPIDRQLVALRYHLEKIHSVKAHLGCIVLNDLDMGAVRYEIIDEVSQFANNKNIPIVIRARRDGSKYHNIIADVLVCTFAEWILLVDEKDKTDFWNKNILTPQIADDFARCSLSKFRNVKRFVILVGDDWIDRIIVIQRPSFFNEGVQLAVEPGLPKTEKGKSQQVGASDVFTGVLALTINSETDIRSFSNAIDIARLATQVYQRSMWNHVPAYHELINENLSIPNTRNYVTNRPFGTPYLPQNGTIDLNQAVTCFQDVYSITPAVSKSFEILLNDVHKDKKSLVLVASGGSGKSTIAKQIILNAEKLGIDALNLNDLNIKWSWSNPEKTISEIESICKKKSFKVPFILVDEALKLTGGKEIDKKGVVLLNKAEEVGIRFLFIDADFAKEEFDGLKSQFFRRVTKHQLLSAWDRPHDIPYVLASLLKNVFKDSNIEINIEASALISIIEWILEQKQSFGNLYNIIDVLTAKYKGKNKVCFKWDDLPEDVRGKFKPLSNSPIFSYNFKLN
jgi:hypothetical protein